MKKFATTAVFLIIAAPALAECPSNDIKESGVVLTRASPYFSVTYEQAEEGLTEKKVTKQGQDSRTVFSIYSHPLLVVKRTAGNEVLKLVYSRNFSDLKSLAEYKTWASQVELVVDGKNEGHGTEILTFESASKLSIGGCLYDVWKISEILSISGRKKIFDTRYYSPKLNIALRFTLKSPNGSVIADTTFDKIAPLQK